MKIIKILISTAFVFGLNLSALNNETSNIPENKKQEESSNNTKKPNIYNMNSETLGVSSIRSTSQGVAIDLYNIKNSQKLDGEYYPRQIPVVSSDDNKNKRIEQQRNRLNKKHQKYLKR